MRTTDQTTRESSRLSLPGDLTAWIEASLLREWAEAEVGKLDWDQPAVRAHLEQHPDYRPRMMLSLLGYAYITGVFSSEEIVTRCYSDTTLQLISQGASPRASELVRFRRENRGLLRGILYQVLLRAVRKHYPLGNGLLPPGLKKAILDNATERLDIARHMDSLEE